MARKAKSLWFQSLCIRKMRGLHSVAAGAPRQLRRQEFRILCRYRSTRAGLVERETRMGATPARLFAICHVLGLRGGEVGIRNKPVMPYGFHETHPLPAGGVAGGRGSPARRWPVALKWLSGRPLERNRHCHQTGTGSATSLCHPCRLRVTQFRMFTGKQVSS